MAEVMPMKIYTIWKENEKPEIRRCEVDMRNKLKFVHVSEILYSLYPKLQQKVFSVYWKDSEDDDVLISSDHELDIAVSQMSHLKLLKLYVQCKDDQPKDEVLNITVTAAADTACGGSGVQASTVICDGCEDHISGFRYKCIICDDYDLCAKCEFAGVHAKHCMIRISMPDMERDNVRAAIKNSRSILKALQVEAYRRARENREKSCERRHRSAGGDYHRRHGERGHRKQRGSWFDTFTTYMNEFANLAGDVQPEPEQKKEDVPEQKKEETPSGSAAASPPESEQATPQKNPTLHKEMEALQEYTKHMLQLIAQQGPHAPDIAEFLKNQQTMNQQETTTADNEENGSKPDADFLRFEKEKSTERADGWTVIESENDGAVAAEISRPTGSVSSDDSINNYPRFVPSIYPPLNVSTAVLNPKAPKERIIPVEISEPGPSVAGNGTTPKPSAPQDTQNSAKPETKPTPKPEQKPEPKRIPHPSPKIDAAIQQMLSMGFTNDGGWLTQLLENKQGDIAAVLDLLTPVNTKK